MLSVNSASTDCLVQYVMPVFCSIIHSFIGDVLFLFIDFFWLISQNSQPPSLGPPSLSFSIQSAWLSVLLFGMMWVCMCLFLGADLFRVAQDISA